MKKMLIVQFLITSRQISISTVVGASPVQHVLDGSGSQSKEGVLRAGRIIHPYNSPLSPLQNTKLEHVDLDNIMTSDKEMW